MFAQLPMTRNDCGARFVAISKLVAAAAAAAAAAAMQWQYSTASYMALGGAMLRMQTSSPSQAHCADSIRSIKYIAYT
jgi:hypothetical protein